MGNYFGLWARCLKDELKKKICNDCHVASSAPVGQNRSTDAAASRHTTSQLEDGDGQTRTHSTAAGQTPPDRWNVKMCAFQQKGQSVVLSHVTIRHTRKKNPITDRQKNGLFLSTNSTSLTVSNTLTTAESDKPACTTFLFLCSSTLTSKAALPLATQQRTHLHAHCLTRGVYVCDCYRKRSRSST